MNKFILLLAMLILLSQENCFATKSLLEDGTSQFNFERSGISFQSKVIEPSKNIFKHAFPEHNQRYLLEGKPSVFESKRPSISHQACDKLGELPKNIFDHVCPDYIQRHLRVCTQGDINKLLELYKEAEDKGLFSRKFI